MEQRKQLSPKIFISDFHARAAFGNDLSADNSSGEYIYNNVVFITIYFNLENLGEEAYHFKIIEKNSLECLEQIDVLKRSETYKIKLHLSTKLVDQLNLNKILDEFFNLSYECKNGGENSKRFIHAIVSKKCKFPFFSCKHVFR